MRGRGEIGRRSGLKIRFSNENAGSSPAVRTTLRLGLLVAALGCTSCIGRPPAGPLAVSVVGSRFTSVDPDKAPLGSADAVLAAAMRPGLVQFDASGQVRPALGESWITTADGLSMIFRLRDSRLPNGTTIKAASVAKRLNAATGPASRNVLAPLLTAVESVVGMTDRVVEIRLRTPRPNLLQLLAQPELGISDAGDQAWQIARRSSALVRLRSSVRSVDGPPASTSEVDLRAERASRAIVRFNQGRSDLVLGGTLADWPLARLAQVRPRRLRFDPARGLLGVAIVGNGGFLADARMREALAMAVDRGALSALVAVPGWLTREQLLPEQLDSARAPAAPAWSTLDALARRTEAARRVATWAGANDAPPTLTIAVPDGPGWRLVLAQLTVDWRAIGVTLVPAQRGVRADLRIVDAVAPNASANWFLSVTGCQAGLVCGSGGDDALRRSRDAATLGERAIALAEADSASAARSSFIVLGAPVRWALVDPRLTRFRENAFAVHPLDQLRPLR